MIRKLQLFSLLVALLFGVTSLSMAQKTNIVSKQDKAMLEEFRKTGKKPAPRTVVNKTVDDVAVKLDNSILSASKAENSNSEVSKAKVHKADANTDWHYTGYNAQAYFDDVDSVYIGGFVNYNLEPFDCDTVAHGYNFSPYSYVEGNRMHTFVPLRNSSYEYTSYDYNEFNAENFNSLYSENVKLSKNGTGRVPWYISYDKGNDVIYAVSLGDDYYETLPSGADEGIYLSIIDPKTHAMKRLGLIGTWSMDGSCGDLAVKSICYANNVIYAMCRDSEGLFLRTINPLTLELSDVGMTDIPCLYPYGTQPMVYEPATNTLLINNYDLQWGTTYYRINLDTADGMTVKADKVEWIDTGYTFFYDRTKLTDGAGELAQIADLTTTYDADAKVINYTATLPSTQANGAAITGTCNVSFVIDGNAAGNGLNNQTLGSVISGSIAVEDGLHTFTVVVTPADNIVAASSTANTLVCGYDAPNMVTNVKLVVKNGKAAISWKAPTTGQYTDFGATFDKTDISYKIIRNYDEKVIVEGLKALKYVDTLQDVSMHVYQYTIIPYSHGRAGVSVQTDRVAYGDYAEMPYFTSFATKPEWEMYTTYNNDNDGTARAWTWNYIYQYVLSYHGQADDWLITPPFKMEAGNVYEMKYENSYHGPDGKYYVTAGPSTNYKDQTNILDEYDLTDSEQHDRLYHSVFYSPSEDGNYAFGFHDYSLGDDACMTLDNLSVQKVADKNAPARVRSLEFVPDAKGALGGTIKFRVPSTDVSGNQITSITKIAVLNENDSIIAEGTAAPGAEASLKVSATHGYNYYKVAAYNDYGMGWPVTVSPFVGLDTPLTPTKFQITWGEESNIAHLNWVDSSEGKHGGYVDTDNLTYNIYKYDISSIDLYVKLGETTQGGGEEGLDVQLLDVGSTQDQYIFALSSSNANGESGKTRAGIILGKPYSLPIVEPLDANKGFAYSPISLTATDKGSGAWTADTGVYNYDITAQNNDYLDFIFVNTGSGEAAAGISSPIFDFSKATHPMMTVWLHHSNYMSPEAYVTVKATTDGHNYEAICDTVRLDGNSGWVEHHFDLSKIAGKNAMVALYGYLPDPARRIYADNITIKDETINDLALATISQPVLPTYGDKASIEVTVSNAGIKEAKEYSVMLYMNDEVIDEQFVETPLLPGQETRVSFPLAITAGQKEYVYRAQLVYDGDENEDNNESTEVELTPRQLDLPAPTDLAANGNLLMWQAPESADGKEVTVDFEDQPAFKLDDIDGWNTADLDGHLTTSFIMYYSNYWPYCNLPLAFMTWNTMQAGCPTSDAWQPYEGNYCLIHWGDYGVDEDGRATTDNDNDWFISPEVKGGTNLSFMMNAMDATNHVEVCYSTTDRDPASFIKFGTCSVSTTNSWEEQSFTVPANAKYIAIHVAYDGFGTTFDNLKYTPANGPQLQGYNVYLNNLCETNVENTEYTFVSDGKYAVSAVYDRGESALSNIIEATDGIEDVTSNLSPLNSNLYNVVGQRVKSSAKGIIIRAGKKYFNK